MCCGVADTERLLVGSEEGLAIIELQKDSKTLFPSVMFMFKFHMLYVLNVLNILQISDRIEYCVYCVVVVCFTALLLCFRHYPLEREEASI